MCSRMVCSDFCSSFFVYFSMTLVTFFDIAIHNLCCYNDSSVTKFLCIGHFKFCIISCDDTCIPYLTAAFTVERCL